MKLTGEHSRTEIRLVGDPRLARGVAHIILHVGQRAGLASAVQREFAEAAESACCEEFHYLRGPDSTLKVTVEDFADRIEVLLERSGAAASSAKPNPLAGVDRIMHESRNGNSRTTLIKFLGKS
ncbi:MAG: hypothetical protein ACRD50_13840 [Candidatus Acidiferrales bacterium]